MNWKTACLAASVLVLFACGGPSSNTSDGGSNTNSSNTSNGSNTSNATDITWEQSPSALNLRGKNEQLLTYACSANGTLSSVWGTDVYTDDSSICSAAVHAGKVTLVKGGVVVIRIKPGQASYVGSTRNGVTSIDYGAWDGSFIFETP